MDIIKSGWGIIRGARCILINYGRVQLCVVEGGTMFIADRARSHTMQRVKTSGEIMRVCVHAMQRVKTLDAVACWLCVWGRLMVSSPLTVSGENDRVAAA